jgi:large subunit ribosomal protein L5
MNENPMREIRIEKVTLNIGCGSDQDKLKRAQKLLQSLTDHKPLITKTKRRTTFGMPQKKAIGVKVTLRKVQASDFLKNALQAVDNELQEKQINGDNFSIGIKEYIDLPNAKYDPSVGIIGMDVCVTLERPGYRVKKRKNKKSKIGKKHLITKNETIEWLKNKFGVKILGGG